MNANQKAFQEKLQEIEDLKVRLARAEQELQDMEDEAHEYASEKALDSFRSKFQRLGRWIKKQLSARYGADIEMLRYTLHYTTNVAKLAAMLASSLIVPFGILEVVSWYKSL